MTEITYIPGEIANAAIDEHGNRKPVTRTHHIFDDAKGKNQAEINADIDNTLALHQSEINALDSQNYATVGTFSELPATGSVDTIYRVSNWDGSANSGAGAVDATVYSEYAWDDSNSEYKLLDVKTAVGEVFDISLYHASGGVLAEYADLAAALGTDGANVPASVRRGGMSVKFVCSSDHKYVQYRLMSDTFNTTPTNWQGVDDEPTPESRNLVESGGTYRNIIKSFIDNEVLVKTQTRSVNASSSTASAYWLEFSLVKNTEDSAVIKISNSIGTQYDTILDVLLSNTVVTSFMLRPHQTETYFVIPENIKFDKLKLKLGPSDNNGSQWTIDVYNPTKDIYDVSKELPTSGVSGTNKYDLYTATRAVPTELRKGGFILKFIDVNLNKYVTYFYPATVYHPGVERWFTTDYIEYENEANIELRNAGKCDLHSEVFEVGGTNSNGNLNNSTDCIRSKIVYNIVGGKTINISGLDGTYNVIWYDYSMGFISTSGFVNTSLTIPSNACFARLVLKKTNVSEATPSIADGVILKVSEIINTLIYDISANHINSNTNNNKFTLVEAVEYIPTEYSKAGLCIRFIDSDINKYIEYRNIRDGYNKNAANWITDEFANIQEGANIDIVNTSMHSFAAPEFALGSPISGGYISANTKCVYSRIFYNVVGAKSIKINSSVSIQTGFAWYDGTWNVIQFDAMQVRVYNKVPVPDGARFVRVFFRENPESVITPSFAVGKSIEFEGLSIRNDIENSINKKLNRDIVNEANDIITNDVMVFNKMLTKYANSIKCTSEIYDTLVDFKEVGDYMNHVPVITISDGISYTVYTENDAEPREDPTKGGIYMRIQSVDNILSRGTDYTIKKASDLYTGENMLLNDNTNVLSRSWDSQLIDTGTSLILLGCRKTVATPVVGYIGFNVYNKSTGNFEGWKSCKVKVDNVNYDLSSDNLKTLYPDIYGTLNDSWIYMPLKPTYYNGYYYIALGAMVGGYVSIFKTTDFEVFEFVKYIDYNDVVSECGVCYHNNYMYVICRRKFGSQSSRLIKYNPSNWNEVDNMLVQDAIPQSNGTSMISRSILFEYQDNLYLATNIYDRGNVQFIKINKHNIHNSETVQQYNVNKSGKYCNNFSVASYDENNMLIAFSNRQTNPNGDGSIALCSISKFSIFNTSEGVVMDKMRQLLID